MGQVIRFIPKAERERLRLIQEARAMYDSVFPPSNPINGQRDQTPITRSAKGPNVQRGDHILL